jgi:hypothetical protein
MRRVLINLLVIVKWDITAKRTQPLQILILMMQAEISVHAQRENIAQFPLGNLFHARLELFQIQRSLAQLVNAPLALKEVTVLMQV